MFESIDFQPILKISMKNDSNAVSHLSPMDRDSDSTEKKNKKNLCEDNLFFSIYSNYRLKSSFILNSILL